jgi:peptidoglycan hydrolase-like protein with peptidoglycan-binding domain
VTAAVLLITGLVAVPAQAATAAQALHPAVAGGFGVAAAPAVKTPAVPAGLPAGIEPLSTYVGQTSCEVTDKPGSTALGKLLKATYPSSSFGVARACQVYMQSEHYDGRAVDWMNSVRIPAQAAQATALIKWLLAKDAAGNQYANLRRLGIMYMIWNNKIWEAYRASAGWTPYNNCAKTPAAGLDSACHRNHIHFSLSWEGAMKRTSYWTKKVAAHDYGPCRPADLNFAAPYVRPNASPCPRYAKVGAPAGASAAIVQLTKFSGAYLKPGSSGPGVTALQAALKIEQAGSFGPKTTAAVVKFKSTHGLGASPVMDQATWRKLLPVLFSAQKQAQKTAPKPAPKPTPAPVKPKPQNPLAPYKKSVLAYNSRGAGVTALQKVLKVSPASGWFGPVTKAAVIRFQKAKKLPATGVVDARTWAALGA